VNQDFLLDTHVWLWYARGDRHRLNARVADRLTALDKAGRLHLSVMSVWELGLLTAKNRLRLGQSCGEWVQTFFSRIRVRLIEADIPTALGANQVLGSFHAHPADRLLVAMARHHGLRLITEDQKILDYARQGYVRAHAIEDKDLLKP